MEKRINLIPNEMAVPPKTVKVVKIITKISTFGAILLFMLVISAISIFLYFKIEHDKRAMAVETLKTKITDLEKNEQRLILAKDRLAKIESIKKSPSIEKDLDNFQEVSALISSVPESALLEVNIQTSKTEFAVTSLNSNSLASFLEPVSKLSIFKNLVLTSLGFSQTTGFTSDIISTK